MNHLKHLLFVSTLCSLVLFNGCIAGGEGADCGGFFGNDCDDWGEECYCGEIIEWGMDDNDPQSCFTWDDIEKENNSSEYIIVKNNCSSNLLRICERGINWYIGPNSDTIWRDQFVPSAHGPGNDYCSWHQKTW